MLYTLRWAALVGLTAIEISVASAAVVTDGEVNTADGARHYLLGVPEGGAKPKSPLVIVLHGHLGSSKNTFGNGINQHIPLSEWATLVDREGIVVAALDGARGGDGKPGWNDGRPGGEGNPTTDDVGFVQAVVARVEKEQQTDPTRLYIMGMSNGGVFSFRLARELPHPVAAIAAACASMPGDRRPPPASRRVSIIMFEGTDDPLMPYTGGQVHFGRRTRGAVLGTDETIAYWRDADNLKSEPLTQMLPHRGGADDPSRVTRLTWGKAGGPQIVLVRIEHGGHCEPSEAHRYSELYTAFCGQQNGDLECADEAWAFFREKSALGK